METRIYLRMLQRGWWIIVLTALAAFNVALALSYRAQPQYRVNATFLVSPNAAQIGKDAVVDSLSVLDRPSIVSTYAEVLVSRRIYDETMLALGRDPQQLRQVYQVSSVVLPSSNVVELTVQGPDVQLTVQLANGMGQRTIDYLNGLYRVYAIDFLDPAAAPSQPYSPQPLRDAGVAAALGLAVGAVLAIVRDQLRTSLENLRERSSLDNVSQAYSRRFFERRLEELSRARGVTLAVGIIQLDGLVDVMDTLPRPMVQMALRKANTVLSSELRGNDIVGRWSDTQFAVLLPATPGVSALLVLERIQRKLAQPVNLDGDSLHLAPCIGVAAYQGDEPLSSLLQRAGNALEDARREASRLVLATVRG